MNNGGQTAVALTPVHGVYLRTFLGPHWGTRLVSANDDKKFINTFMAVLGVLVLISFIGLMTARFVTSPGADAQLSPAQTARVEHNTQPVYAVVTDPDALQKVSAPASDAAAGGEAKSGEEVFTAVCSACHTSGVLGAPKVGDKADWSKRLEEQGRDKLHTRAIDGFKAMPPRGGSADLSDQEVKDAVDFMLSKEGL